MLSFLQLPLRTSTDSSTGKAGIKPAIIATILGLILCLQIGLVLWVYFKQF